MLIIKNKGIIDPLCFELIGASSKREDNSKIGFFGSGLKYALAVLLRNKVEVKIYSGIEYKITTKEESFKGETFERILINDKETGYTVTMGPSWKIWYSLREIYSNAIDEGGHEIYVSDTLPEIDSKNTYFILSETDEIKDFYENIEKYFIINRKPLYTVEHETAGKIEVYEKLDKQDVPRIYRKGILVNNNEIEWHRSLYNYNIENMVITEDRTPSNEGSWASWVAFAMSMAPSREIIEPLMNNKTEYLIENTRYWRYGYVYEFSKAWLEILDNSLLYPHTKEKTALSVVGGVFVHENIYDKIRNICSESNFINTKDYALCNDPPDTLLSKVEEAKKELESFGFCFDKMTILYGKGFSNSTVALAEPLLRNIVFNVNSDFSGDYTEVLFEEWVHITYGVGDETLDMQNVLIKILIEKMRSK